jgi:hypothetical protein
MTICQCLARRDSPYQAALRTPAPYGELLAEFLVARVGLSPEWSAVEVGGGYGSLMSAFLGVVPLRDVTLVDLSPFFLEQQRRALAGHPGASFVRSDAVEYFRGRVQPVDLVISNENIGDLRTCVDVRRDGLFEELARGSARAEDSVVAAVAEKVARYDLDLSDAPERFAFNLGAVEYLEALAPSARAVFLSEHSAEAALPPPFDGFVSPPRSDGYPRRVPLKGHDEYTIKFGHLEVVARRLGYRVERLHLMEFLDLRDDEGVRFMVRAPTIGNEVAEVIHEFYHHVAEYEAMVLTR